jgi:hypothetical protein
MKNLDKAKQQIDLYIKEMMWAKNKDSYAFMLGMIKIYNMMASDGYQYTSIPEEPDVWTDTIMKRAIEQQEQQSEILLPSKKLIL